MSTDMPTHDSPGNLPSPTQARDRILDAAEVHFSRAGLAGARVAAIARDANINKAMIYYYFGSKESLYLAVLHRTLESITHLVDHALMASNMPAQQRLRAFLEGYHRLISSRPYFVRIMMHELLDGGTRLPDIVQPRLKNMVSRVIAQLQADKDAGLFNRDMDPHFTLPAMVAPFILFTVGRPFLRQILPLDPDEAIARFQESTLAILSHGLLAHPGDSHP